MWTYLCPIGVTLKQKHRWKKMVVHFTRKHTNDLLLVKTLLLQCCQIIVFLSWTLILLLEKPKLEKEKNSMAMFFFLLFLNHIDFSAEADCQALTNSLVVKNMFGPQTFLESLGWIIMQTVLPAFVLDNIYMCIYTYFLYIRPFSLTLLCPAFLEFWRLSITALCQRKHCDAYME